ncbi:DUF1772 domain-containing protein [Nocardia cyriacigeorgica]|uniref:DUF1772 domain-containing protein n=1 Tax=Nocardia cyriacigeorgica TaxID=135487 RepID=UPI002490829E|nr:DUF1772 domain-containing protein [Nocardia cyriacigeorgica]BDT88512.1 hypothetical protein FMUAM8_42760 [Nocardia cyriacigeorgica]
MAHQVLTGIAILAVGIIYGTDVFCAVVQRSAMSRVSDEALTSAMGYTHLYGDRRLKFPGALGIIASVGTVITAVVFAASATTIAASAVAVAALGVWFVIYGRVSVPVNAAFTAAALAGRTPPEARALQRTWDSVIGIRAVLQGIAVGALFVGAVAA